MCGPAETSEPARNLEGLVVRGVPGADGHAERPSRPAAGPGLRPICYHLAP